MHYNLDEDATSSDSSSEEASNTRVPSNTSGIGDTNDTSDAIDIFNE